MSKKFGKVTVNLKHDSIALFFFLLQNLTKEQADYCISRMKPYVDRSGRALPDAYDYADFTGSMFVN